MSTIPLQVALAYILALIAAVVWLVRLEGRVTLLDRVLMDAIADRKETSARATAQMNRIEQKVDRIMLRCAAANHYFSSQRQDEGTDPNGDDNGGS